MAGLTVAPRARARKVPRRADELCGTAHDVRALNVTILEAHSNSGFVLVSHRWPVHAVSCELCVFAGSAFANAEEHRNPYGMAGGVCDTANVCLAEDFSHMTPLWCVDVRREIAAYAINLGRRGASCFQNVASKPGGPCLGSSGGAGATSPCGSRWSPTAALGPPPSGRDVGANRDKRFAIVAAAFTTTPLARRCSLLDPDEQDGR